MYKNNVQSTSTQASCWHEVHFYTATESHIAVGQFLVATYTHIHTRRVCRKTWPWHWSGSVVRRRDRESSANTLYFIYAVFCNYSTRMLLFVTLEALKLVFIKVAVASSVRTGWVMSFVLGHEQRALCVQNAEEYHSMDVKYVSHENQNVIKY